MSRLNSHVLDYIAMDQYLHDPRNQSLMLVEGLNRRGLYRTAVKHADKFKSELDHDVVNLWTSWYRHRLLHAMKYSNNPETNRRSSYLLHEIMHNYGIMDIGFRAFYKLDACLITQVEPDELLPQTIDWISYLPSTEINAFTSIFDKLIELTHNPNISLYEYIFERLQGGNFGRTELIVGLIHLKRYLFKRVYENEYFLEQYSNLTLWAIRTRLIHNERLIDPMNFIQAIVILTISGKYEESKSLIDQHRQNLHQDHINIAYANLYITQGKYAETLDVLGTPVVQKDSSRLSHRRLIFIALFALYHTDYEFMDRQILNFQSFLRRVRDKNYIGPELYNRNQLLSTVIRRILKKEIVSAEQFSEIGRPFSSRLLITKVAKECGLLE